MVEVAPLPLAGMIEQVQLYMLTRTCILAKGKTANIYSDKYYAFGAAHKFRVYENNMAFLLLVETKGKMANMLRNHWKLYFLPSALAIIKIPGHSKLDRLEAKENHLADMPSRNTCL